MAVTQGIILMLMLILSFGGVRCQEQVDQKPVKVTKEGNDPTIACRFNSSNIYGMYWYRQYPGEAPVLLLMATSQEPKKDDRFSATFDKQEKQSDFSITKVQLKDAAVYFCSPQDHSSTEALAACTKTLQG